MPLWGWLGVLLTHGAVFVLGWLLARALIRRRPPELALWDRGTREWEQGRWREGSLTDGHWRGLRWLPRDEARGED